MRGNRILVPDGETAPSNKRRLFTHARENAFALKPFVAPLASSVFPV
jgi:hypothetical protein